MNEQDARKGVYMMRKMTSLFLVLSLTLCACAGRVSDAVIDYGDSKIYSRQEMDAAISVIKTQFSELDGCVLSSLQYAGDAACEDNRAYCNSFFEDGGTHACMVFRSVFQSPKNGGGAWEADTQYTWSWYLARDAADSWQLLTYGYG